MNDNAATDTDTEMLERVNRFTNVDALIEYGRQYPHLHGQDASGQDLYLIDRDADSVSYNNGWRFRTTPHGTWIHVIMQDNISWPVDVIDNGDVTVELTPTIPLIADASREQLLELLRVANEKIKTVQDHAIELEGKRVGLEHTNSELEKAKAELNSMLAHEQSAVWAARQELTRFKERVVEVAAREAEERDWCEEINEVLKELGLELPAKKVEITYTITVRMSAEIAHGSGMAASRADVRNSLDMGRIEDAIKDCDPLDYDWDEQAVESVTVEVDSVDEM